MAEKGDRYGKLLVLERVGSSKNASILWNCLCDCGNECIVVSYALNRGSQKSCGCSRGRPIDEIGNRYGRLTVIEEAGRGAQGRVLWLCSCDCGNESITFGSSLRSGNTKSCGCISREGASERMSGLRGKDHPGWRGGVQFAPYDQSFTVEFKESIRKRDLFACQVCGMSQEENSRAPDVHHIDYDKENTTKENCISLCRSCHAKTNHNREYWKEKLSKKMESKYEQNLEVLSG